MQDGDRTQTNVLPHDYRAGAFVNDYAGTAVHGNRQILDPGHDAGEIWNAGAGGVDFDAAAVARDRNLVSEGAVDGIGNFACGREVGLTQQQIEWHETIEVEGQCAFDAASGWNAPDRRMIDLFAVAGATGGVASHCHWALGGSIDLAVGAIEGGQE